MARFKNGLSIEDLLVVIAALVGFSWCLQALSDNTTFVHLRTGIDMMKTHELPRRDPYSYTAKGEPWVLQSWLAELIYGGLHALWSTKLLVIVNAVLISVLAGCMVGMARTGKSLWTFVNAFVVILMGISEWGTRPTTFGFMLFLLLVVTRNRSVWWAVPVGLLWINLHGSWPLGLLWLMAVVVGEFLDERRIPKKALLRLVMLGVATVVGGVCNPVGWRLLIFPWTAIDNGGVFSTIIEWKAPDFHALTALTGGAMLFAVIMAVLLLVHLRVSWRHSLPVVGMLALSLYSQRNFPYLAIALASALGMAWREHADRVEHESIAEVSRRWGPVEVFAIMVLLFIALFQMIRLGVADPYAFGQYPVAGISYAESLGYFQGDKHVYAPDFVGCFRILQKGPNAGVFIDDRYDMYPKDVSNDAFEILRTSENTQDLLDKYKVGAVLWKRDVSLSAYLLINDQWTKAWSDKNWVLYTRNALTQ